MFTKNSAQLNEHLEKIGQQAEQFIFEFLRKENSPFIPSLETLISDPDQGTEKNELLKIDTNGDVYLKADYQEKPLIFNVKDLLLHDKIYILERLEIERRN